MGEEVISVNLLLTSGKGRDLHYLLQGREVDKSDMYQKRPDLFQPGKYPYYWPGAVAIFGGHMEKDETPKQAFLREVQEELGLSISPEELSRMQQKTYHWSTDAIKILKTAQEAFQGNVEAFLGFDLYGNVPECALNKRDREKYSWKKITYLEWMSEREEDHYFIGHTDKRTTLEDHEGVGAVWVPHWVARAICTVPIDKLAILDDIVQRVKSGELDLKVKK